MWNPAFVESLGERGVLKPGRLRWLRALGWMALLFLVVGLVAPLASVAATIGVGGDPHETIPPLAASIASAAVALGLYVGFVRVGERRWPVELGWRRLPELPR